MRIIAAIAYATIAQGTGHRPYAGHAPEPDDQRATGRCTPIIVCAIDSLVCPGSLAPGLAWNGGHEHGASESHAWDE
jgi:hypothetical protein